MRFLFAAIIAMIALPSTSMACYEWQIYTCSEAKPERTIDNLRRVRDENRAITQRSTSRVRVREVDHNVAEDTQVFVLDIEGAPYRHWLHAGEN